jgi:threonine dehydratase
LTRTFLSSFSSLKEQKKDVRPKNVLLSPEQLSKAFHRIQPHLVRTPVLHAESIDERLNGVIYFKCENFQRTGSFKARGALNSCLRLSEEGQVSTVATHSSGNHGKALAWAAKRTGMKCIVAVPEGAPPIKREAIMKMGAEVVDCGPGQFDRERALEEILERTDAHFVPPFEYEDVIAGQSSCAREILEDLPLVDAVLCPVGGGGLAAGSALSITYFGQGQDLILCEPEEAQDAFQSLRSGKLSRHDGQPKTMADGLRTNIGALNFDILKSLDADIHTCSEANILTAMRIIWDELKIICEPSSAVTLAVLLENPELASGRTLCLIVSGGNVRSDFWN